MPNVKKKKVLTCEQCGNDYEYTWSRSGKKYCSRECYVEHKAGNKKTKEQEREDWNRWAKEQRDKNPERYKEYRRKELNKNWDKKLWRTARLRAERRGLEFDIDVEDIIIPEVCPLLGIPLVVESGKGKRWNVPSLDRIDSSKGYVKGNVWVISWRANSLKQDASFEELIILGDWAKELLGD